MCVAYEYVYVHPPHPHDTRRYPPFTVYLGGRGNDSKVRVRGRKFFEKGRVR